MNVTVLRRTYFTSGLWLCLLCPFKMWMWDPQGPQPLGQAALRSFSPLTCALIQIIFALLDPRTCPISADLRWSDRLSLMVSNSYVTLEFLPGSHIFRSSLILNWLLESGGRHTVINDISIAGLHKHLTSCSRPLCSIRINLILTAAFAQRHTPAPTGLHTISNKSPKINHWISLNFTNVSNKYKI